MPEKTFPALGFVLQETPPIYVVSLPGRWLLERTTPSWRLEDPKKGFQRVVRETRAREIALAVLDQRRSFPNAIVLATDEKAFEAKQDTVHISSSTKFLVVDGQHRLWAQTFSDYEAPYSCLVHTGLTEVDMAKLFLEINDNQKRVPSSLRWDLVRLVRPDDDPAAIGAAELVLELQASDESPLYQRIDLTGEQREISLKQGSLAPAFRTLLSQRSPLHGLSYNEQYALILRYFIALRDFDGDAWGTSESPVYKARVIRAFLRLLPDILKELGRSPEQVSAADFGSFLQKVPMESLDPEKIRAQQGSAGIKAIYDEIREQAFRRER